MTAFERFRDGIRTFASDVAQGFFDITHNGLALLGVLVVFAFATLAFKPDLRISGEAQLIAWLQARQADAMGVVADLTGIERATAADPGELPKQQAALAFWLSKKYRVAPEPISAGPLPPWPAAPWQPAQLRAKVCEPAWICAATSGVGPP